MNRLPLPYPAVLYLLWLPLLCGCIHSYPTLTENGEEGVDPTRVGVQWCASLPPEWEMLKPPAENAAGYRCRFVTEVRREGKTIARQTDFLKAESLEEEIVILPLKQKLHAVEYTLLVWVDYVEQGTETSLFYCVDDTEKITCLEPYIGGTPLRACLCGSVALDLRRYRDNWHAEIETGIEWECPQAAYRLVATDVQEFLQEIGNRREPQEKFFVTFSYYSFFPTVFNGYERTPCDSWLGVSFTVPLLLEDRNIKEIVIGGDYLFAGAEKSTLWLTLSVTDSQGNEISRYERIAITCQQGQVTELHRNFLTGKPESVKIDQEYDGEDTIIDLDKLIKQNPLNSQR